MKQVIWKQLPDYPLMEVTECGRVRGPKSRRDLTVVEYEFREWPTSKGSYLTCPVYFMGPRGITNHQRQVHQLVAWTYLKKTPEQEALGDKITVNHIDGDKHNNHVSNLEWATRSEQLVHAYQSGLRTDNVRVEVSDLKTKESMKFYSLGETARHFNVSKTELNTIIEASWKEPYKGRYEFDLDLSNRVASNHSWRRDIRGLNYVNNELHVTSNSLDMARISGINRGTIRWHLKRNSNVLINGWVVKYVDDKTDWPKFTKTEAEESVEEYRNRTPNRERKSGIKVIDYAKGETREYKTLKEVRENEKVNPTTITEMIHSNEPRLLKGRLFRHIEDNSELPHFEDYVIEASMKRDKITTEVFKLTDLKTNVISYTPTIREAGLEIGENPVCLAGTYRERPHIPFKQRWKIERVY